MPRRSRSIPIRPTAIQVDMSEPQLRTRMQLLTYAFSRVPPGQLPLLGVYAYTLVYLSDKGWIEPGRIGKAGASLLGVLSMVTGLLVSYRFSTALSKWDEGKRIWVGIRNDVRNGIRMKCRIENEEEERDVRTDVDKDEVIAVSEPMTPEKRNKNLESSKMKDVIEVRIHELAGLLIGFAFALKHHLEGTRPLPQPPLSDLLPPAYLSSLKRTEARVRFAENISTSSSSSDLQKNDPSLLSSFNELKIDTNGDGMETISKPGIRRRNTGPPSDQEKAALDSKEEWELSRLRIRAEEAVARLAEAVAGSGGNEDEDIELKQQLSQLNRPSDSSPTGSSIRSLPPNTTGQTQSNGNGISSNGTSATPKLRSNLYSPYPPNLPLALLKLMEAYTIGLAEVDSEQGGWSEAKRDRALGIIKDLSLGLANAERLSSNPPPLPLTIHLSHLLKIYLAALPASLLCVVSGRWAVAISIISGWCFLGLEALVSEVGGVFGQSENHHPLPRYCNQILLESLDISPSFMRYYRNRLVNRVGEFDESVVELDRRNKRGWGEEWMPTFR